MTEFTAVGFPLDIQQNFLEKTLIHLLGENSSSVFSKIYENIQFLFMNAPEARQLFKKTRRKKKTMASCVQNGACGAISR